MSSSKKAKAISKSSPSTSSNDITPQTIGKKRSATNLSKELNLFYTNCETGGSIHSALDESREFFDITLTKALTNLSKEDKLTLIHDLQEKSTQWKEQKSSFKDHFDRVYEHLTDNDWKDYVKDFKKRALRDGIPGDYIKSNQVLEDEIDKLTDIIQVIRDELSTRENIDKEKIWRAVISKIEKKDLRETTLFEVSHSRQYLGSSSTPRVITREISGSETASQAGAATIPDGSDAASEADGH